MSRKTRPNGIRWIAIFTLSAVGAAAAGIGVAPGPTLLGFPPADPDALPEIRAGAIGHPTEAMILTERGAGGGGLGQPPLATGSFVNFESPPVKPLALSDDGNTLFAVNTPNNRLVVIDASTTPLTIVNEIPVGLDPVSVAVQPGAAGPIAWVANMISDNVSVVDVAAGVVVNVIDVGDEPVNIVFDDAGSAAFVVCQDGTVHSISTSTRQVLDGVALAGNTPRAAVYRSGELIVAALFSGNNTTVVGEPVFLQFAGAGDVLLPNLWVAQFLPATSGIFADPQLSPWPDAPTSIPDPSPLVQRIVADMGVTTGNPWYDIVSTIDDGTGQPDPAVVAQLEQELLDVFGLTITNAAEVLQEVMDDAKDTVDHDLFVIDVSNPASMNVVQEVGGVGTTLTGMAVNPQNGELFVSNLDARNLTRLEPNLRGRFIEHQVVIVRDLVTPVIDPADLHAGVPGFDDASAPNPAAQAASLANPTDVVVNAAGTRAYVAALGPDRVGVLDAANASVLGRADVGEGPRGLAIDSARNLLFVLNRTDLSITMLDVSTDAPVVVDTLPLFNPEPDTITAGRQFLYSTKVSNNFSSSCATCHIDGHLDHNAWDLGAPAGGLQPPPAPLDPDDFANHPVKGPMVTQSLKGLRGHEHFHWRGDKPTFQDFNEAFDKLLGGSQLSDEGMEAYTTFIDTVVYPPNPFRNRDNSYVDSNALQGEPLFLNACNACHMVDNDGAMKVAGFEADAGGDFSALFAQLQLVTQLRGIDKKFDSDLYNGFGLIHDGREEREDNNHPLETFLKQFFPGIGNNPSLSEDMIAFVTAFPTNVMPVVGWQIMPAAPVSALDSADIDLMIAESLQDPSRCDVVARGTIGGVARGYHFVGLNDDGQAVFEGDDYSSLTLSELLALVNGGDSLVFTAVPPGSGRRMGVDQDGDCYRDGPDPFPQASNFGNSDFDLDVDLTDFAEFSRCFTGAGGDPVPTLCDLHDADCDGDVDLSDFAAFGQAFTGSL